MQIENQKVTHEVEQQEENEGQHLILNWLL